jgi:uncharacterized membrane protein YqgA involved in biofilm formation
MKILKEIIKLNFLPFVLCIGIIIAFQSPGRPITLLDILIGVIIGYYSGMAVFKWNPKQ